VTEELRALLRADLSAERPPPLGDLVAAAMRDGRRLRRVRRWRTFAVSVTLAGSAAVAAVLVAANGEAAGPLPPVQVAAAPPTLSPQSVPMPGSAPLAPVEARTLTVHSGTQRAEAMRMKATSAAMLHLLTLLLPPGRTSHYGVSTDDDLRVQLYFDDGRGPALLRVTVGRIPAVQPPASGVTVTIGRNAADCLRDTVVDAEWPDGTTVEVDVATCLPAADGPGAQGPVADGPGAEGPGAEGPGRATRPALATDDAVRIATDPRWGPTMDPLLVEAGANRFTGLPVFSG
jgi:hypothetical protein